MGDATARTARRSARIVLGVALTAGAVAGVLLADSLLGPRETPLNDGGGHERAVMPAAPTPVTLGDEAAPTTAAPTAVQVVSPPSPAALERWDTTSLDTGDWRDSVAAGLGRAAVHDAPLEAGALHTHLPSAEVVLPETRAPVVGTTRSAAGGESEMFGWDGGEFWFGPQGLVRVREAGR